MRDVSLVVNAFHRKGFHFDMSNLTIQVWWVGGTSLNLPWIIFSLPLTVFVSLPIGSQPNQLDSNFHDGC